MTSKTPRFELCYRTVGHGMPFGNITMRTDPLIRLTTTPFSVHTAVFPIVTYIRAQGVAALSILTANHFKVLAIDERATNQILRCRKMCILYYLGV